MRSQKICEKGVCGIFNKKMRFAKLGNQNGKTFIFILVVKLITCNTKVGEILSFFYFFSKKKTMVVAVISKKTTTTKCYFRNCSLRLYPTIFTSLLIKQINHQGQESKSWVQFWFRITPDFKKPLRGSENESTIIQKLSVKLDSS